MQHMSAEVLKSRHRLMREDQPEQLRVRLHRAISWLTRAEQETDDPDARFIFLWISFNAAYAREFGFEQTERDQVRQFIGKLITVDRQQRLQDVLFRQFTGPIRTLIENKFVFEPFWKALRDHDSSGKWEEQFAASRRVALKALMEKQTDILLSVVLDRLYVLRNQLIHGGATWNSTTNRSQVKDGSSILMTLLPIIVDIMMTGEDLEFEAIAYPIIPG